MAFFKRWSLFILTNLGVMITLSFILSLLGVRGYLSANGINYESLMIFALVWGMGGSFISLLISKWMAKRAYGVQLFDENHPQFGELVRTVHRLSRSAGLHKMPEVGVYESPELNAFATGPSRSNSLVAVSTGLLNHMDKDEVEGVLGHEVAHIANGDMVTMTLLQGIVNAFAIFLSRLVSYAISSAMRSDNDNGPVVPSFFLTFFIEMVFLFLGSLIVNAFSRYREFRADAGGAKFAGREKMIAALQKLEKGVEIVDPRLDESLATMKISTKGSFMALLSTHPPLSSRIQRLQTGKY